MIVLRQQDVADLVVGHGEIALPAGIAWIALGETINDGEALAIGFERLGEIALRHQDVADLVEGHRGEARRRVARRLPWRGELFAVALLARVSGQHLNWFAGDLPFGIELELERGAGSIRARNRRACPQRSAGRPVARDA